MTFTPLTVIYDILEICERCKDETLKKHLLILIENIGYAAPEIREYLFWNGNDNWYGIVKLLNKNCNVISNFSKEVNYYYKNMLKKYKENHGFDGLY